MRTRTGQEAQARDWFGLAHHERLLRLLFPESPLWLIQTCIASLPRTLRKTAPCTQLVTNPRLVRHIPSRWKQISFIGPAEFYVRCALRRSSFSPVGPSTTAHLSTLCQSALLPEALSHLNQYVQLTLAQFDAALTVIRHSS